ncbi:3'-5' exoribonuclease [Nitrospirillum amazonense]|uniref:3'-5' exonuclease n=1 Tax=Nitrospirillum amazonense TaxID=28077 RepID=UPI002DD4494E|nr:3'-5' exoribonuclease [Nitrospirillum amazonense]MEC4590832.1 3'-5' exoribonuclease [Nitrospirillum amazonense]
MDIYFSADVETDGPIPGPFSILSFALVYAGTFDGKSFSRPPSYDTSFYCELKPISDNFQREAMEVNGLDRDWLLKHGKAPEVAMTEASEWVKKIAGQRSPVLVAYPLSFDWSWLYWYFTMFSRSGSPFGHSRCFDVKTAVSVKANLPISIASRSRLPSHLISHAPHTHNALDDAIEQADVFSNVMEWKEKNGN